MIPESADTSSLKAAYEAAERFRWSRDELEIYDYWGIKAQDERGIAIAAEQRGKELGREEGVYAARLATARSMQADGVDPATILKYTGLTQADLIES